MKKIILLLVGFTLLNFAELSVANDVPNKAKYEKKYREPLFTAMKDAREKEQRALDEETDKIRKKQAEEKSREWGRETNLLSDLAGVNPPPLPAACKPVFHFPSIDQYDTNTCWSFATTSYYESEIFRLSGKKIKLSEMWTVYHEYLEKVQRFVRERGDSLVAEGGESNAINRIWKTYGIAPAAAYPGYVNGREKLDHVFLISEIKTYLDHVKSNNLWNEQDVLDHVKIILNKHLGTPPRSFAYNGREMTPQEFLKNETPLNMDDYVQVMSTSGFPFYTFQEYVVPDNWWHSREYLNLPLNEWYGLILKAIKAGYSVGIAGDISEPGWQGFQNASFVPTFDIPGPYINQDSREFRIANETTTDDHLVHLVGYCRYKGNDWFLAKDSWRSARWGRHKGYYFCRGDYVKLKMLSYTVHKDIVKNILAKIK